MFFIKFLHVFLLGYGTFRGNFIGASIPSEIIKQGCFRRSRMCLEDRKWPLYGDVECCKYQVVREGEARDFEALVRWEMLDCGFIENLDLEDICDWFGSLLPTRVPDPKSFLLLIFLSFC